MKDELYKAGDKVYHRLFGEGEVISTYKARSGADVVEVKFNRLETNRNILADTKAMENEDVPIINMEDKNEKDNSKRRGEIWQSIV